MRTFCSTFTALTLTVALGACGGDSTPTVAPTPTPPPKAIVNILIDPNPVIAEANGRSDFPWALRFNLQVSDAGGVAFIVTSMQTTVASAISGGVLISTDTNPFVGEKIAAFGESTQQFYLPAYSMENGTREGTVTVKMNCVDDNGNASALDSYAEIRVEGGPFPLP